jgi:hypothetical protein
MKQPPTRITTECSQTRTCALCGNAFDVEDTKHHARRYCYRPECMDLRQRETNRRQKENQRRNARARLTRAKVKT